MEEEEHAEASPSELTAQLRGAHAPQHTPRLELMRARIQQRLFGASEPPRFGRFILEEGPVGGGMGIVYGAHDPQLDRRVALKLLHPELGHSPVSRDRLLNEARALARLDHPNVVPVHDVVVIGEQVMIVMEWVEGQTLASWERAQPRGSRDLVAAYLEAGRGLAAMHELGLVHRDFKPANAIMGSDGRVRLVDFGLARIGREREDQGAAPPSAAAAETDGPLTTTGEVLGTLGYMAPEQLAGEPVNAAADQYAFCVAMYRAACGVAPFSGSTPEELLASMTAHEPAKPARDRRVPSWLRAVLARGLAPAAAARFPSMTELLDELARVRGWRRWRVPIALALAVAAALLAGRFARDDAATRCDTGAGELAQRWGAAQRSEATQALAGATAATRAFVLSGLDRYRDEWLAMHRAACIAHRDGAQSAATLDRRMTCLRRRRDALASAATAMRQLDGDALTRAREGIASLPALADCADLDLLAAEVELPPAPAARLRLAELEGRFAAAVAQEHLGRSVEALALIRQLQPAAARLGYPPLLADLGLAAGRILLARRDHAGATVALAATEELSFEHGLLVRAVEAAARRMYAEAMQGQDPAGWLGRAEVLERLSRPLRDGFARPLLLNNLGTLHMSRDERAQARAAFNEAKAALDEDTAAIELTAIGLNLAMVTPEDDERARLARAVWERRRQLLGEEHVWTLEALMSHGKYVRSSAQALPLVTAACEGYRRHHPDLRDQRVSCASYRALLLTELGDRAGALAAHDEVIELAAGTSSADLHVRALLATGAACLLREERATARLAFEAVLVAVPADKAWNRARRAIALAGLASLPTTPASIEQLGRAVDIFEQLSEITEDVEYKLRLERARRALAELNARGNARRDRPRR